MEMPKFDPVDYDKALGELFAYHPPKNSEVAMLHERIRDQFNYTAQLMNAWLPASREKSIALTTIQEAMWAANAAVAIHMNKAEEKS